MNNLFEKLYDYISFGLILLVDLLHSKYIVGKLIYGHMTINIWRIIEQRWMVWRFLCIFEEI